MNDIKFILINTPRWFKKWGSTDVDYSSGPDKKIYGLLLTCINIGFPVFLIDFNLVLHSLLVLSTPEKDGLESPAPLRVSVFPLRSGSSPPSIGKTVMRTMYTCTTGRSFW